jgi:tRNA(fMet)-specific endonuclease VapC
LSSATPTPTIAVDTDVLSFIFKHDTRASGYLHLLAGQTGLISFMTVAELRHWAERRNWGATRRRRLESFMSDFVVIHSSDKLCSAWATITSDCLRNGRTIDTADAWIAATATYYGVPLITNNRAHYVGVVGLQVISRP